MPISISNTALIELGASPIISFLDASKEANLCSFAYPLARDHVLSMHPWNCAQKRKTISPLLETPPFGYDYYYQLPTDFLKITEVNEVDEEELADYKLEGGKLVGDWAEIDLKYTARIEDTGLFPPYLKTAIAMDLAARISFSLTQSGEEKQRTEQLARDTLAKAKTQDSKDEPVWADERIDIIEARDFFGG